MSFARAQVVRPTGLVSAATNTAAALIPLASFILATPFLLRNLGQTEYGAIIFGQAATALLLGLDFGLGVSGIKVYRDEFESTGRVLSVQGELFSAYLVIGTFYGFALFIFAPAIVTLFVSDQSVPTDDAVWFVRLVALCMPFLLIAASLSVLPRALEQFPKLSLVQATYASLVWLGAVAVSWTGGGLIGVQLSIFVLSACLCAVYLFWSKRLVGTLSIRPQLSFPILRRYASFGGYAFVGQASSAITYHADKIIVSHFLGPAGAAMYGAVWNIASKVVTAGALVTSFMFPRVSSLSAQQNVDEIKSLYKRSTRFTLLLIFPLLVPTVAVAPDLLRVWLPAYSSVDLAVSAQLLIGAYFIAVVSMVPSHFYAGSGNTKLGAYFAMFGAASLILAMMVLVPLFGLLGAAMGVFLAMLQAIVFAGLVEQRLGFGWFGVHKAFAWRFLLVMMVQLAIYIAIDAALPSFWGWVVGGATSWGAFYVVWFLSSFASTEDRAMLKRVFRLP